MKKPFDTEASNHFAYEIAFIRQIKSSIIFDAPIYGSTPDVP